jgi:tRNA pseudouridine38-40 synthase
MRLVKAHSMRAFRLAYDGTDYYGFQRQPDVPTVEDTLFDALGDLGIPVDSGPGENRPPGYTAAGRTDGGVSALAQTVAFAAPDWLTPAALNGELPGSVRAWASADVEEDFHATVDAVRREYVYHCYAPDADEELVHRVLSRLAGEHDFTNLTTDDEGTVRTLETDFERDGEMLELHIAAGGFPRHLVRRLVTLVADGVAERVPPERIDRVLDPTPLDGKRGVGPAPPEGLVLWAVEYESVAFAVDEQARASAQTVFEELYRERRTTATVAGRVRDGLGEN